MEENTLKNIVRIVYLTPENARFYRKGDLLALRSTLPDEDGNVAEKDNGVVKLRRMFPFEEKETTISVMTVSDEEIGIISDISVFGEEKKILADELERVYFTPKIREIVSYKEKYGFSNWVADTDAGRLKFVVRDMYRSMIKLPNGRLFVSDVDGNRYEIENVDKLSRKSYKKIELYL